jgi:hypothetical protein
MEARGFPGRRSAANLAGMTTAARMAALAVAGANAVGTTYLKGSAARESTGFYWLCCIKGL